MELDINGKKFVLEKPSGYKLLKAVGENKDAAEQIRDLILVCIKEPKLTKEEVENLDAEVFFTLSLKVNELLAEDLKKLQTLMQSNKK